MMESEKLCFLVSEPPPVKGVGSELRGGGLVEAWSTRSGNE